MRQIKPINHNQPVNGLFDWIDETLANASKKVFEPIIDNFVGNTITISSGASKGIGTYLGNEENIKDLVNIGIKSQTGGLLGTGTGTKTGTGTGTGTGTVEEITDTNTNNSTNTIKYVLGGLALFGVGYLLLKD